MDIDLVLFGRWEFEPASDELLGVAKKVGGTTADFRELANASAPVARSVGSLADITSTLREVFEAPEARLKTLGILTHSDGDSLWLRGVLSSQPPNYSKSVSDTITPEKARTLLRQTVVALLKGKILPDAEITLYGCHTGSHPVPTELLGAFAKAFEATCHGFKKGLQTCVNRDPSGKIADRGWIRGASNKMAKTCLAAGCVKDLKELKPDAHVPFVRF
jgi:hypothetical protein